MASGLRSRTRELQPLASSGTEQMADEQTGAVVQDMEESTAELPVPRTNSPNRPSSLGSMEGIDFTLQLALQQLGPSDANARLQLILEHQRDVRAAAERAHQLEMARLQMSNRPYQGQDGYAQRPRQEDFPVLEPDGDLDRFLQGFERACKQYQLPEAEWVRYLTPRLKGKALDAYLSVPAGRAQDYESVKAALIQRYQLTPEVYRLKFRSIQKKPTESFTDATARMCVWFQQWTDGKTVTTKEELADIMLREQLLNICPEEVQQYILDQDPGDVYATAALADRYVANRRSRKPASHSWRGGKTNLTPKGPPNSPVPKTPDTLVTPSKPRGEVRRCFACNQPGHISPKCPNRHKNPPAPRTTPADPSVYLVGGLGAPSNANRQQVTVGDKVVMGFRDTGAGVTLVQPDVVPLDSIIPGKTLTLRGIGQERFTVPMAWVHLDWGAGRGMREVGVMPDLPANVLLGTDLGPLVSHYGVEVAPNVCDTLSVKVDADVMLKSVPQTEGGVSCVLPAEFSENANEAVPVSVKEGRAVVSADTPTPAGADDPLSLTLSQARPSTTLFDTPDVNDNAVNANVILDVCPVTIVDVPGGQASHGGLRDIPGLGPTADVAVVTRSQRAKEVEGTPAPGPLLPPPGDGTETAVSSPSTLEPDESGRYETCLSLLSSSSQEFRDAVQADPSLDALKERAARPPLETDKERVYWEQGRLYRETVPTGEEGSLLWERHLVVPQPYRAELSRIAHDIPLAGHLGVTKTKARLSHLFYWPRMGKDVARYCCSCDTCQRMGKAGQSSKAPMIPMPIITEPFQWVAVDLIGPLSIPSRTGKRYILTVVDYATRYPEAVALSSTRADVVAKALVGIFSRVGFPREMLTDQGTQFMSALMQGLCKVTEVQHLVTSPYHPQTNGLCERFNGTLKQMLRMLVESHGPDWEPYLPHLLFAYREVPQASTGFSPFELLYGRRVRGPLALVKESWEGDSTIPGVPVVEYVLRLRKQMQTMAQLVHDNVVQAQANQKRWYDQNAREKTYQPGQKVWVLVPEPPDKLQAKWAGPYVVHQQVNSASYLVTIDPDRNRHKVFHVNMMKDHHDREASAFLVCSLLEEGEEDGLVDLLAHFRVGESPGEAQVNPLLAEAQRSQLNEVLHSLPGLFSGKPGRTDQAIHHVDTGNHTPIRRSPYRVSSEVQVQMRKEIDEMLELGVIQPSHSAWASPVVLVPKKDRTTRFCVDYRGLNEITVDDAYPMPRIDDLLDRLGKAQYLSIMDLSRGYWQIPLSPQAQERSAFITPFGLYESTVLPFGMKNAPATFQRMVNSLLSGCEGFATAYLDDIAVFSPTWEEHLQHLAQVLGRIHQAGLTIKPEKCQLGMREVQYLGHRVGGGALRPEPEKLDVITSWPTPRTKRQVMSFLGTAGYYRKFVPNYSALAAPLTDLTKKKLPQAVQWTAACEHSFRALKAALASAPVLQAYDESRPLVLQTDASTYGLGAVLSQVDSAGHEHPVQYLSRKLLPRGVAYATVEKECLAIVWALQHLQPYLYGRHFTVVTDHNPLTWIKRVAGQNGRLLRWSLVLQQYNYDIRHKPGRAHGNADGLSRRGEAAEVCEEEDRRVLLPPSTL
ncbi:uncharacterized protein LOC142217269 [Leptodactylus fuscus]|uniref:uncharacterized protein LOC142217269 n=1 Tax=Leptodactylus fuscus TaxID=238119 RepID=UPI003F4E8869